MDSETLGMKLAKLIAVTYEESLDDIRDTMGECFRSVPAEYAALLLWIATREIYHALPKNLIESVHENMLVTFGYWILPHLDLLDPGRLDEFIESRFILYYCACHDVPDERFWDRGARDAGGPAEMQMVFVLHNFILSCSLAPDEDADILQANARYDKQKYPHHMERVIRHYRLFLEKVKSILSQP